MHALLLACDANHTAALTSSCGGGNTAAATFWQLALTCYVTACMGQIRYLGNEKQPFCTGCKPCGMHQLAYVLT